MRAIFIEAAEQRITELDFGEGVRKRELYKVIQEKLGVRCFTVINIDDGDTLYIDDEGLLKDPEFFFTFGSYPQPLAGNGLILGVDEEGDDTDATLPLDKAVAAITFLRGKVAGFTSAEGWAQHPTLGNLFVYQSKAVIVPREGV